MDKWAQQRSWRSRIFETVNLPGAALEGLHGELGEVMDDMRALDEQVRDLASDIQPLMRKARSDLRQRRYLDAAFAVSKFHQITRQIDWLFGQFDRKLNIKHHTYLLEQFQEPNKSELFDYNPKAAIKEASVQFEAMTKEAGIADKALRLKNLITDVGANVLTSGGWHRWALERIFSKDKIKEISSMTSKLVDQSEQMMGDLLGIFGQLEAGVSRRKPELYLKHIKDFRKKFANYHKLYLVYDTKIVEPLRQHQAMIAQQEQQAQADAAQKAQQTEQAEVEEARKSPLVTPFVEQPAPPKPSEPPKPPPKELSFEEWKARGKPTAQEEIDRYVEQAHQPMTEEPEKPEVNPKAPLKPQTPITAHQSFVDRLVVCAAHQDVSNLVRTIVDYSAQLEDVDTDASKQLLMVAREIVGMQRTAGPDDWFGKAPKTLPGIPTPPEPAPLAKLPPIPTPPRLGPPPVPARSKSPAPEMVSEPAKKKVIDRFKHRQLDLSELSEGLLDKFFADIPVLSHIREGHIQIPPGNVISLIEMFLRLLDRSKDIQDADTYRRDAEHNLLKALRSAIYQGFVTRVHDLMDPSNPDDKALTIKTRINLSSISSHLQGKMAIPVICRLSATKGILTVFKMQPAGLQFDGVVEHIPVQDTEELNPEDLEEADEHHERDFDDYPDYPDYE